MRGSYVTNVIEKCLGHGDGTRTAALVTFGGHNHIVIGTHFKSKCLPCCKVVGRGDSSADSLLCANRPVLIEGGSSLDGRLTDTLCGVDIVRTTIASNLAK